MKQSGKIYMRYQRQFPESTSNFHVYLDTFVELRLLIVKHFLLSTMEQCWEETMPPQMWSCWLHLCIMYCPMFVWESYLRCLPFQILYNELGLHWLYKLAKEPPGKHLYHLFIFCSLLIFRLIWNKYSMLTLIDALYQIFNQYKTCLSGNKILRAICCR